MTRIADKYLIIQALDPSTPNLFLAHLIGAKGFRRDVLLHLIKEEKQWEQSLQIAKRCAYLNHSNILQILDVGQHEQSWYVTYEFVEALTISELLQKKTPLNTHQIIFIVTELLKALNYAYSTFSDPICHQNIHPNQVLLTKQGCLKLRGFSLECPLPAQSPYRHPEMSKGFVQDMFGVGIMLKQLCSLHPQPQPELLRISAQACSNEKKVRFQSFSAMYDILLHLFPLNSSLSIDMFQQLLAQSFNEWEDQPTFISRTIASHDTEIFVAPKAVEREQPPKITVEQEETFIPPNPTKYPIHHLLLVSTLTLILGFILGYSKPRPSPFRAILPPDVSLYFNNTAIDALKSIQFDKPQTIRVEKNGQNIIEQTLTLEQHQTLIIIPDLPLCPSSVSPQ